MYATDQVVAYSLLLGRQLMVLMLFITFLVSVYAQTFRHQMKTPTLRTRKIQLIMDIYCYEPVDFSVSLGRLWTTVCVSLFHVCMNFSLDYCLYVICYLVLSPLIVTSVSFNSVKTSLFNVHLMLIVICCL